MQTCNSISSIYWLTLSVMLKGHRLTLGLPRRAWCLEFLSPEESLDLTPVP